MLNFKITITLFLFQFSVLGQEILTLEDVVKIGLKNNYSIQIAENEKLVATNNNTLGNAGFLPTVELTANKTYERTNVDLEIQDSEGTFNVARDWAQSDRSNARANLNWTIFDGMNMFIQRERLSELQEIGELNFQSRVSSSVSQIMAAYFEIMIEQERLNVIEHTLEVSEERLQLARDRYEVGKGSKLDFLAAQVDYNADKSSLMTQKEIVANARVNLNSLLARDVDTDFIIEEEIIVNDDLLYEQLLEDLRSSNPDLLIANRNNNVALRDYQSTKTDFLPTLDLDVGYSFSETNNEAGQLRAASNDGLDYGLSATWTLFDGFNQRRRVQNAKIAIENAQLEKRDLLLVLESQLKQFYIDYRNNLQLIELEMENLDVAEENETIALARFELGVSNPLQLREAQRNALEAKSRLLNAQFATKIAELNLLHLSGSLIKGLPK